MEIKYFKNVNTFDELKKMYRDLMKQYHPDLNKGNESECTEICKCINQEFEYLFHVLPNKRVNKEGQSFETKKEFKTPKAYMDIINKLIQFANIEIDVIGSWLWVSSDTKPIKEILKELNFKWHSVRKAWYLSFSPFKSSLSNLTFDELKDMYGSETFASKSNKNLSLAVTR